MHIVFFSESYPPVTNGVAVSTNTLRQELLKHGHRVTVVTAQHPRASDDEPDVIRLPTFTWPTAPDYPLPQPRPYAVLHQFFRNSHVDVIHVQIPFVLGVIGVRLGKRYNIPLVAHYHTLYDRYLHYVPFIPQSLLRWMLSWHLRRFYRAAETVIVPSRFARQYLQTLGVQSKQLEVIPTGVQTVTPSLHREAARTRYGLPCDSPIMVYVGRLAREKNVELLLEMLPLVLQEHPNALLWLVGSGTAETLLRERAHRWGVAGAVRFQGRVSHEDIGSVYAAGDVFVFPSATETQGLVITEAQAHGLPCVVVNEGGAPESVRDGIDGLLVTSNANAFASAVIRLLKDDSLRVQMSENARQAANWTPKKMTECVLKVYESVIASHTIERRLK